MVQFQLKQVLFMVGLLLSTTFAYSQGLPRIRFSQIQKDTLTGSVLVSGQDSSLSYSRDLYLSDNQLRLYTDTIPTKRYLDSIDNLKLNTSFSNVTGTLPVANGGTGATTLTSGSFLKGNGTSAIGASSNLSETADTVFVSKFLNVDTTTLFVDADSNRVGIGTSSPSAALSIVNTTTTPIANLISAVGSNNSSLLIRDFNLFNMTQFLLFHGDTSNLHVGAFATVITGETYSRMAFNKLGTIIWSNGSNAHDVNLYRNAANELKTDDDLICLSLTETSDARAKQNISESNYGLQTIMKLNPVKYNLIGFDKYNIGFVAQDVKELIPEIVNGNESKEMLGISYSGFHAVTVKAIQEQQTIIENQKQEIDTLKTQYETLLQRIIILENK